MPSDALFAFPLRPLSEEERRDDQEAASDAEQTSQEPDDGAGGDRLGRQLRQLTPPPGSAQAPPTDLDGISARGRDPNLRREIRDLSVHLNSLRALYWNRRLGRCRLPSFHGRRLQALPIAIRCGR